MPFPTVTQLIPVLQTAIGPVILISGVGLLLLTMTNRLGRAIDRARNLAGQLASSDSHRTRLTAQLTILWRRARLIRLAIMLAAHSALFAGLLVIVLFFTALWEAGTAWLIGALFTCCMLSLIGSLIVFMYDINQSLNALRLELDYARTDEAGTPPGNLSRNAS
jgi:hypothetical protein